MTDASLELPNTRFQAVLDLGGLVGTLPPLPRRFAEPELGADIDDENESVAVFLEFEDGQLHLEVGSDGDIRHHFHTGDGGDTDRSPWSGRHTAELLEWATSFTAAIRPILPTLIEDALEAAEWHDRGFTIFTTHADEPKKLDIIDVELEGEVMMLPWLGAGSVGHEHLDDDKHTIELLWGAGDDEPSIPIARAWLDPRTEEPRYAALPGVDWTAVGEPEADVLHWLEGMYVNHHIEDPASSILRAALEAIAGVEAPK